MTYDAPPSGQSPYGGPAQPPPYGYAPPRAYDYTAWFTRVLARLVDSLLYLVPAVVILVGVRIAVSGLTTYTYTDGTTRTTGDVNPAGVVVAVVGGLLSLALLVFNEFVRQGRTGQTFGKSALGIRLVKEATGEPIGAGMAFVRYLAHILDGFCYIGYLWPLWDAKRQTFADKVMSTVVIRAAA